MLTNFDSLPKEAQTILPGAGPRMLVEGYPGRPLYFPAADAPEMDASDNNLGRYLSVLRRGKWVLLAIIAVCTVLGYLVTKPQTRMYQSKATIEVLGLNDNFMNMKDYNPNGSEQSAPTGVDTFITTQIELLQSESLLGRTIDDLKLDSRLDALKGPHRMAKVRSLLGLAAPVVVDPRRTALEVAAKQLRVQQSRQANIVEIIFYAADPHVASDFANTLAKNLIDQNLEARWKLSQNTGKFLSTQLVELKAHMESSERQLQEYGKANDILYLSEKDSVDEQRLRQDQEELSKAAADRIAKQSRYASFASSAGPAQAVDVSDDGPMRQYQVKLADLRQQLAQLSSIYTPDHYKVKKLQAEIAEVESSISREKASIISRMKGDFDAAEKREGMLANEYNRQKGLVTNQASKSIHYDTLKREVDTSRALYETMLQKVNEAGIASAIRASNLRVVDAATPSPEPFKPNPPLSAALGFMGGLVIGLTFLFLRDRGDKRIHAPGTLSAYLQVPELGAIPSARSASSKRLYKQAYGVLPPPVESNGAIVSSNGFGRVELAVLQSQPSLLADSFRAIMGSILFTGQSGKKPGVIALSSPQPAEGKTTVVSNLGVALAEIGKRVLLVDGDIRKPRLNAIFDVSNDLGVGDILRDDIDFEMRPVDQLVQSTQVPGLSLFPSGTPTDRVSNVFHSDRMNRLIQRFREHYDVVLIDCPPLLLVPEARTLGRMADSMVLVLRAGKTTREIAGAARRRLAEDGIPILGIILNDWKPEVTGSHYYGS